MSGDEHIHLPDPTPWPMVLALGTTLIPVGLVTHLLVSAVGAALCALALYRLIREDIELFEEEGRS